MNSTYADDLRFALEALEEYSCLGLDLDHGLKLRPVMIRLIERAEADQVRYPLQSFQV